MIDLIIILGGIFIKETTFDKALNTNCKVTVYSSIDNNTVITSKFTDANFKTKVYSLIKKASPAPILYGDVKNIIHLNLDSLNISSLSGIEYFTSLTGLTCYSTKLTTLDVSKNIALIGLGCGNTKLTTLDVSKNTALTELNCSDTKLTTLDLGKNTALTELYCSGTKLTTLNLSKNTALTILSCSDTKLRTLDVSKNIALTELYCSANKLTTLDVNKNIALTDLYCGDNQLRTLDVSKNSELTGLYCDNNQITTLYSINDTGDTECYRPQYTDSTRTSTTDGLVITLLK